MPLACLVLAGCGVITAFLESVGVPVGPSTKTAAGVVDEAIRGWTFSWFDWLLGAASTETVRASAKVGGHIRRKRAAKKALKQETRADEGKPLL